MLVDTGHSDVAYHLLLNTEYPSWGYLVEHGATTMWERWNGDQMRGDPSMNSYNHYAYGAVADWIYRYAAGIDALPVDAGFHTIYLHPNFDARLGSLDLRYQSSYGEIRSAWSMNGTAVTWLVTVPPNTTAQMPLPASQQGKFTVDGEALASSKKLRLLSSAEGTPHLRAACGHLFVSGDYAVDMGVRGVVSLLNLSLGRKSVDRCNFRMETVTLLQFL